MRLLIAYGTTDGHTRIIANRIAEWVLSNGFDADVMDTASVPDGLAVTDYDAYVLAGSLHMSEHQASLVHFVKDNVSAMRKRPSALVSSSLTAVIHDEKHMKDAQDCIDTFTKQTGLRPTVATPVAGALQYTKYDWMKRMLMKKISQKEGGDTDTTRDFEYTDWDALKKFVEGFLATISVRATA